MTPAGILKYRKLLIIIAHILTFAVSLMMSFLLTTGMQFRSEWLVNQYPLMLSGALIIKLTVFGLFKQYRGWWRYVGITDLLAIVKASLVSTTLMLAAWYPIMSTELRKTFIDLTAVGSAIFLLDLFFTILLLSGLRMAIRLYNEEFSALPAGRLKRFLIIGAGNAGEALLREIHRMSVAEY